MNGWYRLSQHLTMRDVAAMAGYTTNGEVLPSDARRARGHLRRVEARSGQQVLWGSNELWTTLEALRSACPELVEEAKADAERAEQVSQVVDEHTEKFRVLGDVIRGFEKRLKRLESRGKHPAPPLKPMTPNDYL